MTARLLCLLLLGHTARVEHAFEPVTFVHIPKTGGTSIEEAAGRRNSVRMQLCDQKRQHTCDFVHLRNKNSWMSPWHLVPDVFEKLNHRPVDAYGPRQQWCVVRRPSDRYASCRAWATKAHMHWGYDLASEKRLLAEFAGGRFGVDWHSRSIGEEHVHKQPQHWFVWDATGAPQCHCVVAFEKLGTVGGVAELRRYAPVVAVEERLSLVADEVRYVHAVFDRHRGDGREGRKKVAPLAAGAARLRIPFRFNAFAMAASEAPKRSDISRRDSSSFTFNNSGHQVRISTFFISVPKHVCLRPNCIR